MSMYFIQSLSGTGSSGTITFTNIPQNFTHLQVRATTRQAGVASQIYTRLNGDAGSNYASHYMYGTGGTANAGSIGAPTTVHTIGSTPSSTELANVHAGLIVDVLDYTNTNKNKTLKGFLGLETNSSTERQVWVTSSVWMNTSAVTSLTIVANTNYTTSSKFDLYGIVSSQIATGV